MTYVSFTLSEFPCPHYRGREQPVINPQTLRRIQGGNNTRAPSAISLNTTRVCHARGMNPVYGL